MSAANNPNRNCVLTLDPDLKLLGKGRRRRRTSCSGGRARGQELGHQGRPCESQRVEEREDSIRNQGDCKKQLARKLSSHMYLNYIPVTGFEVNQKMARMKYWTFWQNRRVIRSLTDSTAAENAHLIHHGFAQKGSVGLGDLLSRLTISVRHSERIG